MRFLKYLIVITILIITKNAYSACESGVHGSFESNLSDPPYSICASHTDFGSNKCIMEIYTMEQRTGGWTLFGQTTGETCTSETELNKPVQYNCTNDVCPVTEEQACPSGYDKGYYNNQLSCVRQNDDDTLQCNSDRCLNPDNKFCPSGYKGGTFNGNSYCIKNENNESECEVDCDNPDIPEITDDQEVNAINYARSEIVNTINNISADIVGAISDLYSMLEEKLTGIANNQGNTTGTNNNGDGQNNGDGENNGDDQGQWDGDTSGIDAELPTRQIGTGQEQFSESNFGGNSQCPADKNLSISIGGKTYTYSFSFLAICNGLQVIGYFILIMCYLFGAKLVVEA